MVYCPHCGWPNKANSKFCSNCSGILTEISDISCAVCGASNAAGATVCVRCGARLDRPPASQNAAESGDTARGVPGEQPNPFRQMDSGVVQPEYPPLDESIPEPPPWLGEIETDESSAEPEGDEQAGEGPDEESPRDELFDLRIEADNGIEEPVDEAFELVSRDDRQAADTTDEQREEEQLAGLIEEQEPAADAEATAAADEDGPHVTVGPEPDFILPSWLAGSDGEAAAESPTVADAHAAPAGKRDSLEGEHMPEWLSILNTPPDEEPGEEADAAADEDVPAWLREMTAPENELESRDTAAAPASADSTEEETAETFEWPAVETSPIAPPEIDAADAAPSIVVEQSPAAADEETIAEPESPDQEPVVPDWLASGAAEPVAESESPVELPPVPAPAIAPSAQVPVDLTDGSPPPVTAATDQKGQAPGETAEVEGPGEESEEEGPFGAAALELEGGEIPEWVRELAPAEGQTGDAAAGDQSELPDWLREPTTSSGIKSAGGVRVPDWLNELTPSTDQAVPRLKPEIQVTEQSGPLAGVAGVIPLAAVVAEGHVPSTAAGTRVNGGKLFEAVLAAEQAAAPTREEPRAAIWQNRAIYLLVLLAALVPLFFPSSIAGMGLLTNYNTPTVPFHDAIQAVPPGATVLMAFDYEPGQSLEMDPIAAVVAGDLARHKVNIVALSTVPAGARLAQTVLDGVAAQTPGWKADENYVNAGYLRGEEAGLRELAESWLPGSRRDFAQHSLASLPLTARVKGLPDFSLVILVAGSDANLKAWMDQVQPTRPTTFIAAVSAAVEPSARNNVSSKQISGLIRGLTGAAEYQSLSQQGGMPVHAVDAQSLTQWLLAGLIVLANIVMLAGLLRPRMP